MYHRHECGPPKQLKALTSRKATLTVALRLGKAKKTKHAQTIELVGPAASKPTKAKLP